MRIWFIHPRYYDKKGILAQWNEGLILKNIIYGKRSKITVEKNKKKGKVTPVNLQPKAWVNHPFSKRVLRYKKNLQKKTISIGIILLTLHLISYFQYYYIILMFGVSYFSIILSTKHIFDAEKPKTIENIKFLKT